MYRDAYPLFLLCETPLHAGSGSDLGIVDLPIQRERHTGFPKIESSSLKGGIRESFERKLIENNRFAELDNDDTKIHRIFGYDDSGLNRDVKEQLEKLFEANGRKNTDFAGAIGFSDARILLFPIKSMKGVFAWATCPRILSQFFSDLKHLVQFEDWIKDKSNLFALDNGKAKICKSSTIKLTNIDKAVLEEYTFEVVEDKSLTELGDWLSQYVFTDLLEYWKEKIKKDIILLPDDDFKDFVNLSTEVITRTKIDNIRGTVENRALFTEEYLPSESLMYSLVFFAPEFRENGLSKDGVFSFFREKLPPIVQIGGNATLGKGIIRTKLLSEPFKNENNG